LKAGDRGDDGPDGDAPHSNDSTFPSLPLVAQILQLSPIMNLHILVTFSYNNVVRIQLESEIPPHPPYDVIIQS
jgi:hypothetical protein